MEERVKWIDVYKGIAISLVIVGHCPIPQSLYNFIYSFHLVAFFFIAGYTFKLRDGESFWTFAKKKAKRLVIPYFFFGTMWMITNWVIKISHHTFNASAKSILNDVYCLMTASGYHDVSGPAWFLFALFTASLIFWGIAKYQERMKPVLVWGGVMAMFIVGYAFSGKAYAPFQLTQAFTIMPFMWVGHLMKRFKMPEMKWWQSLILSVVAFAALFMLAQHDRAVNLVSNTLMYNPVRFFACGIIGIMALVLLSLSIKCKLSSVLAYLGVESMTLMGIHQEIRVLSGYLIQSFIYLSPVELLIVNLISIILLSVPIILFLNKFLPFFVGKE